MKKLFALPEKTYIEELNKYLHYDEHNAMVKKTWKDFRAKKPSRMPMHIGINPRFLLLDKRYNINGITFKDYTYNSRIMFDVMAEFVHFCNMYVPYFHEMGENSPLFVYPDFQNFAEAASFGAEIIFSDLQEPYAKSFLNEDNKNLLLDKGLPDFMQGIFGMGAQHYFDFLEYAMDYEIDGARVENVWQSGLSTDGPFTIACELLTPTLACMLIYDDYEFMKNFLNYLTEGIISRIKTLRKVFNLPEKSTGFFFADDSIAMLSNETYQELILPCHKKLKEALCVPDCHIQMHLCGDATRHFKSIETQLGVKEFDSGFPVNFGKLTAELSPETVLYGGPSVGFLEYNDCIAIENEVKRIIEEVKPNTKFFVMREGNNIPPKMDLNKILAIYKATIKYGEYK